MSYNYDFSSPMNVGYALQVRPSFTNNYIMKYSEAVTFADFAYNKNNDFFKIFSEIFLNSTSTQQLIKSFRWYPFDLDELYTLPYGQGSTIGGQPLTNIFRNGETIKSIDFTFGNNTVLLGDFTIPKFQNIDSFLSYEPYTHIQLYLPFYNSLVDIDAKRIKQNKLYVHGVLDFLEGDMIYVVTTGGGEYIDSYRTHITIDIPLFYQNLTDYLKKVANSVAGGIGGAVSQNYGNVIGALTNSQTNRMNYSRLTSGSLDALQGYYAPSTPILLVYRPVVKYALNDTNYAHIVGVPCEKVGTLSQFSGYTVVEEVHTNSIVGVTDPEINEIENLLKKGVRV